MTCEGSETGPVPSVTVVLPVLNGERWITECLRSLRCQTFQDFEILVIDDGCTDNTIAIVRGMDLTSLRIIQGPQQGLGAALACGVSLAQSPYVARQDADDLSHPRRLEIQMAYMTAHPDCVIVGSWAHLIDEQGSKIKMLKLPEKNRSIKLAMNIYSPFVHPSVLLRRDAILRAGNYRTCATALLAEDYDLWSRMASLGDLHNIQQPLVSYRKNPAGMTSTQGRALSRSACTIAIRNSEATLGKKLNDSDTQLFFLFFGRHRRMRVREALHVYQLRLRLLLKSGFPPATRGITWRGWLAPISLVVRAPISTTPLWENGEVFDIEK